MGRHHEMPGVIRQLVCDLLMKGWLAPGNKRHQASHIKQPFSVTHDPNITSRFKSTWSPLSMERARRYHGICLAIRFTSSFQRAPLFSLISLWTV